MVAAHLTRIGIPRTAFFLCDIQERFRDLIYEFPHVISTAKKLVPLLVTEQHPKVLGKTVNEIDISNATMTIAKTQFSMCVPEIDEFLKQSQIRNVVLFGIEAHVCVLQTAMDLLARDMQVCVMADGVSSQNPGEVSIALKHLQSRGATVTSSDSVMFQMLGDAKHERFKDISQLVKKYASITSENTLLRLIGNRL